jgi:hypothetical protein
LIDDGYKEARALKVVRVAKVVVVYISATRVNPATMLAPRTPFVLTLMLFAHAFVQGKCQGNRYVGIPRIDSY